MASLPSEKIVCLLARPLVRSPVCSFPCSLARAPVLLLACSLARSPAPLKNNSVCPSARPLARPGFLEKLSVHPLARSLSHMLLRSPVCLLTPTLQNCRVPPSAGSPVRPPPAKLLSASVSWLARLLPSTLDRVLGLSACSFNCSLVCSLSPWIEFLFHVFVFPSFRASVHASVRLVAR